jgi:transcription-repair coupling factor (superfamily II helicase)
MGQKGTVIKFRKNRFDKIPELISLIARKGDKIKMRQDESVVYKFFSNDKASNIKEIKDFIGELEEL